MKKLLILPTCLLLSGCFSGGFDFSSPAEPQQWTAYQSQLIKETPIQDLQKWWRKFDDPALNNLVDLALAESPDRLIAEARIMEARGLRRSSKSFLFPQLDGSASGGRQDTGISSPDSFYDAGFDASFEIDIFGKNRKNFSAADSKLQSAEAAYHDETLTLIADVVRSYIDFRAAQSQFEIAEKNLIIQQETLSLIEDLNRLGDAPRLDVERAANLVNTTRASLPEFQRQADNARLSLSILTGALPEKIQPILSGQSKIPGSNITPVLMAPAQVLSLRPDVRAAAANLEANTALAESATAEFFPAFNLGGFYGVSDGAFVSSATIWNVALGGAVALLDFGRIEGRIDAARGREKQAFEQYRKTVIGAVVDVETALNDYARINDQGVSLRKAYESAASALAHSETLYKEGEISFLDVLDAQRSVNNAESALVSARTARSESLIRIFKSLGVY